VSDSGPGAKKAVLVLSARDVVVLFALLGGGFAGCLYFERQLDARGLCVLHGAYARGSAVLARALCAAKEGPLGWAFLACATLPLALLSWLANRKFRKSGLKVK